MKILSIIYPSRYILLPNFTPLYIKKNHFHHLKNQFIKYSSTDNNNPHSRLDFAESRIVSRGDFQSIDPSIEIAMLEKGSAAKNPWESILA